MVQHLGLVCQACSGVANYPCILLATDRSILNTGYSATLLTVFTYLRSSWYRHGTCSYPAAMGKSSKRRRVTADRSATVDVVTQLEIAFRNPHAAAIGAVIGGLIPWFGRTLAHEIPSTWAGGHHALALAMGVVVLGCASFSGISVYKFGRAAFKDKRKALGFVLALEGVMLVSQGLTSAIALTVLVLINAVANGSVIALDRDATCRKRAADARGAETRARSRAASRAPAQGIPVAHQKSPRQDAARWTWPGAGFDGVVDAEIVSEQKFLA